MNADIANTAIQFLARVDLKGAEVPAFNMVVNALQELTTAEQEAPEKAEYA